ncbi:TPA: hypothetical protein ACRRYK_003417 [Morganella morganii]
MSVSFPGREKSIITPFSYAHLSSTFEIYRIHLAEGQNIKISFEQNGISSGIQIFDRELKTLDTDFLFDDDQSRNLCIETKATYGGMYLIRILSEDPNVLENGKFKLDISTPSSGEKVCQIDAFAA